MLAISKRKPEIQRKRFVVDRAWFLRNLIGFVHASDTGLLRPVNSPGPNPAEQFYPRPLPAPGCGHRACRGEAAEGEVPVAVFPPEQARHRWAADVPRRQWVSRIKASVRCVRRQQASVQWVSRIKTSVRWTLVPANGRATDGTPWSFEQSRTARAKKGLGRCPGEARTAKRRRAPVLQAQHDCAAAAGFHGVSQQQMLSTRLDRGSFEKYPPILTGLEMLRRDFGGGSAMEGLFSIFNSQTRQTFICISCPVPMGY